MPTLYDQPPRCSRLQNYVFAVVAVARDMGYNPNLMTPDEWKAAAAVATAALAIQSADAFDEQLAGFGHIADDLVEAVRSLRRDDE